MEKVLVTGGAGYIGSVLIRKLLERKWAVTTIDNLSFGGEALMGIFNHSNFTFVNGDITEEKTIEKAVQGVDHVVHLAAIVGDPACAKNPKAAERINDLGSKLVYETAKRNQINRFVFASTCSNYGKMDNPDAFVDESSELKPVSLYAKLKVKFENYVLGDTIKINGFCPTLLRFSTVYGLSPRMRFDLTVNEFTRDLILKKELEVFGEQFNRPYCHVDDLANSIIHVLQSPEDKVKYNVFNVGDTSENYTKKMIVEEIIKIVPDGKINYVKKDEDPRDYRVNFEKIKKELDYKITKTVPMGIREIKEIIKAGVIADPYDSKYQNV